MSTNQITIEETEEVLEQLVASGDVEKFTDDGGYVRYRLTPQGSALAEVLTGKTSANS